MAKSVFTGDYENFRLLLIEARNSAGLTQIDLARKLGRPQSFVSKYERGERRLDVIEFIDVAHALGIDPAKFLQRLQRSASVKRPTRLS
ncbi:MAG: helix-turn-helix domain-containing protein [Nitrospiraceae bacterium]